LRCHTLRSIYIHKPNDGQEPSCGGGLRRWRAGGWQRWELAMLRPLRSLRGWPVRLSESVHRWCIVCCQSGRGERARCSAWACCAGWGRTACEMRVGGPHGQGGHASPAVCALQPHLIDDTNPRCGAAGVAWVRALRWSSPHLDRWGRWPAGSVFGALSLPDNLSRNHN